MKNIPFTCDRTCRDHEQHDHRRFNRVLQMIGVTVSVNSHVIQVDIVLKSLDAIRKAAERLGMTLEKKSTYRWFGEHVGDYPIPEGFTEQDLGLCDYALCVKGHSTAYEAGLVYRDGGYRLLFDFWGEDGEALQDCLGVDAKDFVREYSFAAAGQAAQQVGWHCERSTNAVKIFHPDGGTITVDGSGTVDALGFQGQACHDPTKMIAEAIGGIDQMIAKPEFHNRTQRLLDGDE